MRTNKELIKVAKFGGTSVKTPAAIERLHQIVKANPEYKIIVVSALGGVTNLLVDFANASPQMRDQLLEQIVQIHLQLCQELQLQTPEIEPIIRVRLTQYINVALTVKDVDHIISLGEDLSSTIIHSYLQQCGLDIELIDARDIITTDNNFSRATPLDSAIKSNCEQHLSTSKRYITQGFVGATPEGLTTTLGRGGSDYSAALFAEGIAADEVYIYTDVEGVYTMDPNIVKQARPIPQISFQEMAEMANFGAKVLHPATLEPCAKGNIPVIILSSFNPSGGRTLVTVEKQANLQTYVRAITIRKSQILVTIRSLKMINTYGFLANIFSLLAKHKISVDLVSTSEASIALTIDGNHYGSNVDSNPFTNSDILEELKSYAEIEVESDFTLVSVIGSRLTEIGSIQTIINRLSEFKIRVLCYGASNSNVGLLVPASDATAIAKLLHQQLIEVLHD